MSKFAIKCRKGKLVYPAVMAVGMLVVGGNTINYDLAKRWKNGPQSLLIYCLRVYLVHWR